MIRYYLAEPEGLGTASLSVDFKVWYQTSGTNEAGGLWCVWADSGHVCVFARVWFTIWCLHVLYDEYLFQDRTLPLADERGQGAACLAGSLESVERSHSSHLHGSPEWKDWYRHRLHQVRGHCILNVFTLNKCWRLKDSMWRPRRCKPPGTGTEITCLLTDPEAFSPMHSSLRHTERGKSTLTMMSHGHWAITWVSVFCCHIHLYWKLQSWSRDTDLVWLVRWS